MNHFWHDHNGNRSSMRIVIIAVAFSVLAVFLFSNFINVILLGYKMFKGQEKDITITIIDFKPYMITALAAVLGGKVGQSISERKNNKTDKKL